MKGSELLQMWLREAAKDAVKHVALARRRAAYGPERVDPAYAAACLLIAQRREKAALVFKEPVTEAEWEAACKEVMTPPQVNP
jgi:hypothetical protein